MSERRIPRRAALYPLIPWLAALAGAIGASGPVVWEALAASLTNTQTDLVVWGSILAGLGAITLTLFTALFAPQHGYAAPRAAAIGPVLGVITLGYWLWELMRIASTS